MNFETIKYDNYTLISFQSEKLDSLVAPDLKSEFVHINKQKERNILMDISNVKYCDSSGLSALLIANRICKEAKGSFIICGIQPMVKKLLKISQLDKILIQTPTLPEAIDYLYMEELERNLGGDDLDD
ncbi:MAG: STAS domain-containing protein [Flavobacteriales bacterium]|nr:STAS domain-containing protein [Flavobacteriales bacterium]